MNNHNQKNADDPLQQTVELADGAQTRRGRKPLLSPGQREAVLRLLREPPELHGFGEGGWTRTRVQILLQRRFGVHLSLASISGLRAALDNPETATAGTPVSVPSDIGLFMAWARHSSDAVAWYDRKLRPLYANAVLLNTVRSTLETLREASLYEHPAWTSRLPEGYTLAVRRVAASGASETLQLPSRDTPGTSMTLKVLVQCDAEGGVRSIATVLRVPGSLSAPPRRSR